MIQVRCPKCSTTLALKQAPAAGKVKCPKCGAIIAVGTPSPVATPQAAAKKPAIPPPSAGRSQDGEIDFRTIPIQSAPAPSGNFPMAGSRKIYDGPIELDPIPKQRTGDDEEEDDEEAAPSKSKSTGKKSSKTTVIVALIVVLLVLGAGGGFAFWKLGGAGN
jgi:phage FluMu protein Com